MPPPGWISHRMFIELTSFSVLLACAFGWVGLDLLRKFLVERGRTLPITFLLVAAQLPLFALWATFDRVATGGPFEVGAGYWPPGLGTIAVNLLANLAYMRSVRLSPMSATLPLLSLSPVFTTLLAIPMLGEWPRSVEALGIVMVVAGAFLLNAGSGASESGFWRGLVAEKGAPWMVAAALFWSLSPPLDKLALRHATPGVHVSIMGTGIVLGLWAALFVQGRQGEIRGLGAGTWRLLLAAAAVSGVAIFFQLWAIRIVWVGLVETVKRGVGSIMALVLGRLLFREELTRRRLAAVVTMVVGVGLVLT